MPKAIWNNVILAESDQTIIVEGNHYFPPDSIKTSFLRESAARTFCAWKGTASYYDIVVDDQVNEQAAWFYPAPKTESAHIQDYVAFWKGVQVS